VAEERQHERGHSPSAPRHRHLAHQVPLAVRGLEGTGGPHLPEVLTSPQGESLLGQPHGPASHAGKG
jgi:hypothetical protein